MAEQRSFRPKRILEILHKHRVDYIVVGGIATTLQGAPFQTTDVDICPALQTANFDRLASALEEMDARLLITDEPQDRRLEATGAKLKKWLADARFLHFLTSFGQLDLLHRPAGTEGYRDLVKHAAKIELDGVEVRVADLRDIIRSKQAVGRQRDLVQLPTLRKLLEMKEAGDEDPGAANS